MRHPDEGTIHGWLDGALSPEEAQRVEQHVAACPQCAGVVAEARGLIAASSRILGALDHVPAAVVPEQPAGVRDVRNARSWRRSWRSPALAAAAVLLLVVGVSTTLIQQRAEVAVALDEGASAARVMSAPGAEALEIGAASPTSSEVEEKTQELDLGATTSATTSGSARVAGDADVPAPPPAPVPAPAPAAPSVAQSGVAARTLQAPVLENVERPEPPRLPLVPDTMRRRIAGISVVTQGVQQGYDSLGGRVVAANVERARAEEPGEADPLTRGAIRLSEEVRAVRPAERRAAAADSDGAPRTAARAAPVAPPAATMDAAAAGSDTGRVQLLVVSDVVDTTVIGVMRTVIYELRPGIRVQHQIVERRFVIMREPREAAAGADTIASDDPPGERTLLRMDLGRVRALHWTDAGGVHHSLSGPVELEELQRVRATLREEQRSRR